MSALARRETSQVAEIAAELDTLHIGARSAIDEILPSVRRLLDVDNMLAYSLAEQVGGWTFERWHQDGNASLVRAPLARMLASAPSGLGFYDPSCPDPSVRNRVLEATAWVDRDARVRRLRSRVYREVLAPLGMRDHKQLRVHVCNGAELLGWFGTITPSPVTRRHYRLLSALVPAMRRRLTIERRLAAAPHTIRALEVALARIGAPAFVVTARGTICEANTAARVLLDQRRPEIALAIADAHAGRPNPIRIELTPVTANGAPDAWLAILRADTADARVVQAIASAAARWSLTPRQLTVLEHVVRGNANATIAILMHVSVRAVELHVSALLDRVGMDNRTGLVAAVLAL